MYELFLIACVGGRICDYTLIPMLYTTEARCEQQAALLAGMQRGSRPPGLGLSYRFRCQRPGGAEADWVSIEALATRPRSSS